jgi:hypothetical protein
MKQEAFAEMFGVDVSTVSRWERGKLRPSAKALTRMREIVLRSQSILSEEAVEASHVYKYVLWVNHLTKPILLSKGITEALEKIGVSPSQVTTGKWNEYVHGDPKYSISVVHALETIQGNKGWLSGHVAYAEARCWSIMTKRWVHVMVAPLPDERTAIMEAVEARDQQDHSTWVRVVPVHDLIAACKPVHTPQ